MKRLLLILLFLFIPFSIPTSVSAADPIISPQIYTCRFEKYTPPTNIFSIIWTWITNLFSKPHIIETDRDEDTKAKDLSNYGIADTPEYKEQHSFAGSRSTSNNTQECLKGKIIEDVLLNGTNNSIIGSICLISNDLTENCFKKQISDLAHYLLQTNQKFLCDENDLKIDTPLNIIDEINRRYPEPISAYELPCYGGVHDDFYLTPPTDTFNDEKNTIKIMDQPIPYQNQDQDQNKTVEGQEAKIKYLFSPQSEIDKGKASGLEGLRPAGWL